MAKLTQLVLQRILKDLMKDQKFVDLLLDSIVSIRNISQPDPTIDNSFEMVIDRIMERLENHAPEGHIDVPGLRNNLIGMLRENQFMAFTRVLRMLQDLFGYSDARIINYLEQLEFQNKLTEESISPWIDVPETATAILDRLDPSRTQIFAKLSREQRCLLKGFSLDQINVMSNFSPRGMEVLSRITSLPSVQRIMICGLSETESGLFKDFGIAKIRSLLNLSSTEREAFLELDQGARRGMNDHPEERLRFLEQYSFDDPERADLLGAMVGMDSERFNGLRELIRRDGSMLESLTDEAADLAGSIYDLTAEERTAYLHLDPTQFDAMNQFNEHHRRVIMSFDSPSLNEVVDVLSSFHPSQTDVILSLRQEELEMISKPGYGPRLAEIEQISLGGLGIIREFSVLHPGEEEAIMGLNREQRSVLSKSYVLGHDGLFMIKELGLPLALDVFKSEVESEEFTLMQMALISKLQNSNTSIDLDEIELTRLFEIIEHDAQAILLNLSWRGVQLLERSTNLNQRSIEIAMTLSTRGIDVLTTNDRLTEARILALGDLDAREGRILIDLDRNEREYLSSVDEPTEVLGSLSPNGRLLLTELVPLTPREKNLIVGMRRFGTIVSTGMNVMEKDLFATLTLDEISLLSSVMTWHFEESAVFTFLRMRFDSRNFDIEPLRNFVEAMPHEMSPAEYNDFFKLMAGTIELFRVTETITDDFIDVIASLIGETHGTINAVILKLHLLNYSMRDSKSLEERLVSQITGNEDEIFSMGRTHEIQTMEDVIFMRWLLSQPSDLNGGIFHKFAEGTLTAYAILPSGEALGIIVSKSTSRHDGIDTDRVLQGFRKILRVNNYSLAAAFFFAVMQRRTTDTTNSVIGSLTATLTPDDCYEFLSTPVDQPFLDRNLGLDGDADILSNERFSDPTVLDVSLYYDRGDPIHMLRMLDEARLWSLLERRPVPLLELMARNRRYDLLELYRTVENVNQLSRTNRVSIFNYLMRDLEFNTVNLSLGLYRQIGWTIRGLAYLGSFIGRETYVDMVFHYMEYLLGRVSKENLRSTLHSFISDDVNLDDLARRLEPRFGSELYAFLIDHEDRGCSSRRDRREAGMICVDSKRSEEITSEEERRSIGETFEEGTDFVAAKGSGIARRIDEVAGNTGLAFTVFLVGKHIARGDAKGLGYDALNLWVMPKIGERIASEVATLAERYDLATAKGFAPVIGSAVGNLAAFLGLAQGITALQNASDPVDEEMADLNIVTNSVFIAANVPAVATQIMSRYGVEIGVAGEFLGPVGAALAISSVVASFLIGADLEVEKLAEHIKLSEEEKRSLYWRFLWDKPIPKKLLIDLTVKNIYARYISDRLRRYRGTYDGIAVSLPAIMIKDVECVGNTIPRRIRRDCVGCTPGYKNTSYAMNTKRTAIAGDPFSAKYENGRSRLIPETLEGYDLVCGPSADDAVETTVIHNIPHTCDTEWNVRLQKFSIPSKPSDDCVNLVSFRTTESSNSTKKLFYLAQDASIESSDTGSMDLVFHGKRISFTDPGRVSGVPENRYYFMHRLRDCRVHKGGRNFFYLRGNHFKCDLGEEQHNIVVVRNDFSDSRGIHSIIGNEGRNRIQAEFAEFVDGKGGGDFIRAGNRTVVKGYLHDLIVGQCTVLLPLSVSDIYTLVSLTRTNVVDENGLWINVDRNSSLITADGFFLTPIRVSDITHTVTRALIRKTLKHEIVLEDVLESLRRTAIPDCDLVKHLSSANYDIVLSEVDQNIFYMHERVHGFYWEAPGDRGNLYVFGNFSANVTISKANGILDFQDLKIEEHSFDSNGDGGFIISIGGLSVTLLPNYGNVTTTFDGKKYFKLVNREMIRDYCSHPLRIVGRVILDATHLHNYHNCFEFDSDKILFLQLKDDLVLVSGTRVLTISKYYSALHGRMDLAIKSNRRIVEPRSFQKMAENPHKLTYYNVSDSGLQIYHNQPVDGHFIGFVDLKDKSINEFDMNLENGTLSLVRGNSTLVRIEEWGNRQSSREMMFAFKDSFLVNAGCIILNCEPHDVIGEFHIGKNRGGNRRSKRHPRFHYRQRVNDSSQKSATNDAGRGFSWINSLVNGVKNALQALFRPGLGGTPNEQYLNRFDSEFLIRSNVNLAMMLLQTFLDKNHPLPMQHPVTSGETLLDIMNFTERYAEVLNETAQQFDMPTEEIDLFQLYSEIAEHVRYDNYNGIQNTLKSVAGEIYTSEKEFLTRLDGNLRSMVGDCL